MYSMYSKINDQDWNHGWTDEEWTKEWMLYSSDASNEKKSHTKAISETAYIFTNHGSKKIVTVLVLREELLVVGEDMCPWRSSQPNFLLTYQHSWEQNVQVIGFIFYVNKMGMMISTMKGLDTAKIYIFAVFLLWKFTI
jgi:hypothetical protein